MPKIVKTANGGEWAEIEGGLHFLVEGRFEDGRNPGRFIDSHDRLIDKETGTEIYPMSGGAKYGITPTSAEKMLAEGKERTLKAQKNKKRDATFSNEDLEKLCGVFGIQCTQAGSHRKADLALGVRGSETIEIFFVQSTTAGDPSISNAGKNTRISWPVGRTGGAELSPQDEVDLLRDHGKDVRTKCRHKKKTHPEGHREVKARVQTLYDQGFELRMKDGAFFDKGMAKTTKDIGHQTFFCMSVDFLKTRGKRRLLDVLAIHKAHAVDLEEFNDARKKFRTYIKERIFYASPTKVADIDTQEEYSAAGMLLITKKGCLMVRADGEAWWGKILEGVAVYDTPDSDRHDYGYVYRDEKSKQLRFSYAFAMRGVSKTLVKLATARQAPPSTGSPTKVQHSPKRTPPNPTPQQLPLGTDVQ